MDIRIVTRLNDASNQRWILISGLITISIRVGTRMLGTREFMCLFTSDRRSNMMDSAQTLEIWMGDRVIVDCKGRIYAGEMPKADVRSSLLGKFFLSIFMMCIEARDNLEIDMDGKDLHRPLGFYLLSLWRRNFQS